MKGELDESESESESGASGASESDRWVWELELPSFAALGTLATVLLPHVPLLHGALVLAQLSIRSSRDEERGG